MTGPDQTAPVEPARTEPPERRPGLAARAALATIRFYQRRLSPLLPPTCRFEPTCSQYAKIAVERFGLWRGGWLATRRIARCHPWHPGGWDPVPEPSDTESRSIR